MTVQELIDHLRNFPPESHVHVSCCAESSCIHPATGTHRDGNTIVIAADPTIDIF